MVSEVSFESTPPPAADYLSLLETTGWNDTYRLSLDGAERALAATSECVAAYSGAQLVGFARSLTDGELYAVVFDVIVEPSWQRQGLGSELVRRLVAALETRGVRDILLFAAVGTVPFYEELGFVCRPGDAPGMLRRVVSSDPAGAGPQ